MMTRWIALAVVVAVLAAAAALTLQNEPMTAAQADTATAEATPEAQTMSNLPSYGPAPELKNAVWLNTPGDQPLKLADLRGKVVLLHFWTFECINCIHTLPYVIQWNQQYAADGLVVIGDHFPEFPYERELNNLKEAITRLGIPYAVTQDNDAVTWNAYNQMYWPTMYLIDKQGNLRYRHIGEGAYTETEAAIQALLAEPHTALIAATAEVTSAPAA